MKQKKLNEYTGMIFPITYIVLFVVSSIVLYFANQYFPEQIVLGTMSLTPQWAIVLSMGTLALFNTLALPFIREYENAKQRMLTNAEWMVIYFFTNAFGLWIISRFAEQFGMGVSSWTFIAGLAIVLDVTQGAAMMFVEKGRSKNK